MSEALSLTSSDEGEEEAGAASDLGEEEEGAAASEIKSADQRRARECADDIDAAGTPVTTRSEAIDELCKAMPAFWTQPARDLLVSKLNSPSIKFFPTRLPTITLHADSTRMDDALWAMVTDEVMRLPLSRTACNLFKHDMIVAVAGCEWLICGFILPHATSPDKLHLFFDLTNQATVNDWIAVLFNAHAGGGVTSEVR